MCGAHPSLFRNKISIVHAMMMLYFLIIGTNILFIIYVYGIRQRNYNMQPATVHIAIYNIEVSPYHFLNVQSVPL